MPITAAPTTTYEVTGWHLDYKDGRSDKFYSVYAFSDGTLVLNWGRTRTSGQTKIDKYTPEEAQTIARRQVYAKAGKGYKMRTDAFVFSVDEQVYQRVLQSSWASPVQQAMQAAKMTDQFTQTQGLVTTHYDTFIEQTNQMLDAAADPDVDFEALYARWEKLSAAWVDLDGKHQHAATAVSLAAQAVQQKLMG